MPRPPTTGEIQAMTEELAELAGRLTDLLAHESTLVRAMRIKEIGPLQGQKTSLTARYQKTFTALTAAHNGKALPLAIKERLAVSGQRLAAAVAENELALRVGKIATDRLIGSIIAAVKDAQKSTTAYAPRPTTPRHGFMTAAAVDRRL